MIENNSRTQLNLEFPKSWKTPLSPGYGTYPGKYGYEKIERWRDSVLAAIKTGYRHIDTAQTYSNESYIGEAIRNSEVDRDDIFLTSKLLPERNSYDGALERIEASLSALKTNLDLFLIHYPGEGIATAAWKGLIKAKSDGLCKHIGVSNFEMKHLEQLLSSTNECPEVNQIEFHPLLFSKELNELVEYCKEKGIVIEGYCPLAWGDYNLMRNDSIKAIARKYGEHVTTAQVILKWCMQHGVRPIVGSLNSEHISENAGPYNFELSPEEMITINALGRFKTRVSLNWWGWDPPAAVMT
jgi:diketogulonate reductase-like aldo/keto reductase